jgi:TPR repeat protein
MRRLFIIALLSCTLVNTARAADIGGWMAQNKANGNLLIDECADLPTLAAQTPRHAPNAAQVYYATGVCYLESSKLPRDPVAAAAWLRRAAHLGHAQARQLLLSLPPATVPQGTVPQGEVR